MICPKCHGKKVIPVGVVANVVPCPECSRDARAEMPTRNPCPLGDFTPSHNCWLCNGAGVDGDAYRRWVLSGKPDLKPEKWDEHS